MLHELLSAEELEVGVLNPLHQDRSVRELEGVLQIQKPDGETGPGRRSAGGGRKAFGVVALVRLPVDQAREHGDRMAHVEEIVQPGLRHVGLSGLGDYGLHGGLFPFGFRTSTLTFGAVGASLGMAMFAIDSMCCKNVALGRLRASRPDTPEREKPLDVANRQCAKALESCSRPTIYKAVIVSADDRSASS